MPPDFSKETVDRWQVFGGMAGVAALAVSAIGGLKDSLPLSLAAGGVVTLVGVLLLYRWGRQAGFQRFLIPVVVTLIGALTTGFLIARNLSPSTSGTGTTGSASRTTAKSVAPAAAGEPARFREGRVVLNEYSWVDLDSHGESGGVGSGSPASNGHDLSYSYGLNAAERLAVVSAESPGYRDCYEATDLRTYLDGDTVKRGPAFCVKTSEGRWARVVVDASGWPGSVTLDVVVWEKE
ncbi:hypothetical protein [Saccharothrix violaceirubra]|uniref:Uncharacterized protein n=1 Tax=Saccharothrix violaceirubra TaxID=413306 RepID=A0A7W7T3A1_9PSEU|nr:hypothetical protein [Saccharothrix violaceirubra]MBB4965812.1 hypothetical protein [Saccharothrix violaceirubra]